MTSLLFLSAVLLAQPPDAVARLRFEPTKTGYQVVAKLSAAQAAKLPVGRVSQEAGEAMLMVGLVAEDTGKRGPNMLGKYEWNAAELTFTPRFPLAAGQNYRATLRVDNKTESVDFRVPAASAKTPPKVVKIYPTTNVLPANHLKFYIYFDRPMRGGEDIFNKIVLVDDKGKEITDPWLIDEIWDEENNCLIIYIHPGRIKWGVELRELLGPVLFEKRNYSLIVRGELTDLDGNKIGKDFVKQFRTTPEDRVRIDLGQWKLSSPAAGSRESLVLTLPKTIDHRSLQRFLAITDDKGKKIEGTINIGKEEKSWHFTPKDNWQAGVHHLDIAGELEDVAGNTPLRPFDLDLTAPRLAPQNLRLKFQPSNR